MKNKIKIKIFFNICMLLMLCTYNVKASEISGTLNFDGNNSLTATVISNTNTPSNTSPVSNSGGGGSFSGSSMNSTVISTNNKITANTNNTNDTNNKVFVKVLSFGDNNNDVLKLQNFLINKNSGKAASNLKNIGSNGNFGPATKKALIEYQLKNNLKSTGILDSDTLNFINSDSSIKQNIKDDYSVNQNFNFNIDLSLNSINNDVRLLQEFLNNNGFIITNTGPGSKGKETNVFGLSTKKALIRFQIKNNISPANGNLGPKTRKVINSLY